MANSIVSNKFDVAIVGGGINGAVSAAALASRGYKVLLIDREDFGGVTSSQSSNLIWGGIKYLQTYEFALVFKLCIARFRLMRNFPTRVRSIGFLASLGPSAPFGKFMGTIGTLVYWAIGQLRTPAPKTFGIKKTLKLEPSIAKESLAGSVLYFDGMLPDNDSRFVWDFVKKATELGATARNYVEIYDAEKVSGGFTLSLRDRLSGEVFTVNTTLVINAAGPYVKPVNDLLSVETKNGLLFSKGIHLVVRQLTTDERILAFWDEQGRLFYVIPMHDRSVIGTTDTRVTDPAEGVSDDDRDFVLRQINKSLSLEQPLTRADIISERCGVRALVSNDPAKAANQDWHKLSRKHFVESNPAGVVSILGGKFTDCLNVGEEILHEVTKFIPAPSKAKNWIGEDPLKDRAQVREQTARLLGKSELSMQIGDQLWRRHGGKALEILNQMEESPEDRELVFQGLAITFAEVKYILDNELIRTSADLLRRRLPIALVRSQQEIDDNQRLQAILSEAGVAKKS
jgi:glycerol-3-phosphate dehydrogenase